MTFKIIIVMLKYGYRLIKNGEVKNEQYKFSLLLQMFGNYLNGIILLKKYQRYLNFQKMKEITLRTVIPQK